MEICEKFFYLLCVPHTQELMRAVEMMKQYDYKSR